MSRLPFGYVIKRSLVIMPFVLLIVFFVPFLKNGELIASFNIGSWQITIFDSGLEIVRNVVIKALLSIITLVILTATTSINSLLKAMDKLRIPKIMVMLLSFMYRYIFILTDEVMRMKQARDSRSFGGSRMWQVKTIGQMIGTLFIRSYERGERVYAAMVSRGFNGQGTSLNNLALRQTDWFFGVFIISLTALGFIFSILG
jgi:cobalt/nickel transport system permease protein